jgi:hypothetical protein
VTILSSPSGITWPLAIDCPEIFGRRAEELSELELLLLLIALLFA